MKKLFYVLYLNANDEVVASGTAEECAKQLQISTDNFYSRVSKNEKGICHKYTIYKEEIKKEL